MGICVLDNEFVDYSKSLLNEEFDLKGINPQIFVGVVALSDDMEVLPLVSEFLTRELRYKSVATETVKTYGNNLIYLLSFLRKIPSFRCEDLDQALLYVQSYHIEEYFTYLKNDEGLTSKTIRNRDASYKAFFDHYLCSEFSNKKALREDNPYDDGLLSGTPKSNLIEMCTLNELVSLMKCTPYERERLMLQFMFDSGVRRSEMPRITKQHIDDAWNQDSKNLIVDDNTVEVASNYRKLYIPGSKGRNREIKPRYTLVSVSTLKRIKRYHASPLYKKHARKFGADKPAFLNAYGGKYTRYSVGKLLERLSNRAIKRKNIKSPISPHKLRHGFAISVLSSPDLGRNDVDRLVIVKNCLGHNELDTTQVYTSVPYDIYGSLVDRNGEILCRHQLMDMVVQKTSKSIDLRDKK